MKTLKDNVSISTKRLQRLPMVNGKYLFEDVHVIGYFDCSNNYFTSLEGCPEKVGGSFYCTWNKLTSLQGCPKEVGGDFICSYNPGKFTEEDVRKVCKVRGKISG